MSANIFTQKSCLVKLIKTRFNLLQSFSSIIPMPQYSRYNKSVSDHVTNKYNGAYASNIIIVWCCLVIAEAPY